MSQNTSLDSIDWSSLQDFPHPGHDLTKIYRDLAGGRAFKVSKPTAYASHAREVVCLERLRGVPGFPELLFHGRHAKTGEWVICLNWIEGERLADLPQKRWGGYPRHVLMQRILLRYRLLHSLGILHGDVKPQNIIVQPDGEIVLLDFGSAHAYGANPLPLPPISGVLGSNRYRPPEVAGGEGDGIYRITSETFSLGCLMYFLAHEHDPPLNEHRWRRVQLVGSPWQYDMVPVVRYWVPQNIEPWNILLRTAVQQDSIERYQDVGQMLEGLEDVASRYDMT